jgi:hypothetical protein
MTAPRLEAIARRYFALWLGLFVCLVRQSGTDPLLSEVAKLKTSTILPTSSDTRARPLTPPNVSAILPNSSSPKARPLAPRNDAKAELARAHELSSVDYRGCCGLGHRIGRTSDAYYLAWKLRFGLRTFWGFCDETEVFHFLFGPQPLEELSNLINHSYYLRVNNKVHGFAAITRKGTNETTFAACACSLSKAESDVSFYSGLRQRFFARTKVEEFRKANNWDNPDVIVIGMHARVGNGETGDFSDNGRNIPDLDGWITSLATLLLNLTETLVSRSGRNRTVKLFIATDTTLVVQGLTTHLKDRNNGRFVRTATPTSRTRRTIWSAWQSGLPRAGMPRWMGERVHRHGSIESCRRSCCSSTQ